MCMSKTSKVTLNLCHDYDYDNYDYDYKNYNGARPNDDAELPN